MADLDAAIEAVEALAPRADRAHRRGLPLREAAKVTGNQRDTLRRRLAELRSAEP